MSPSACLNDATFGPFVHGCRDDFDFTLQFERIIFSIIPSSCFVVISLVRLSSLIRRPTIVTGNQFQVLKAGIITAYAALKLAEVVLSATIGGIEQAVFVASTVLQLVVSLCMISLSWVEHYSSPKSSVLLNSYLLITLLLDVIQARSLWLVVSGIKNEPFRDVFTASISIKVVMMVAESWPKSRWLQWNSNDYSPEETSGVYGIGSFAWLNRLFVRGYTKNLTIDDLFPLDHNIASKDLGARLEHHLERHPTCGQRFGLAKALLRIVGIPLLIPVFPRLLLLGFKFCQPFLIHALLSYLGLPSAKRLSNDGYGLIIGTFFTYSGIAVSTAVYNYFQERTIWMMRGALVTVIYKQTIRSNSSAADNHDALTLMSTDIERVRFGLQYLHDFWATAVQIGLAAWLLSRELGIACLAPMVVVVACTVGISILAGISGEFQEGWMEHTEMRVGLTSSILARMKQLKLSGMARSVEKLMQQLRVDEVKAGSKWWTIETIASVISFVPLTVGSVVAFTFTDRTLDATTIFTSMSYVLLLTEPLTVIFQLVPSFVASFTCLRRIQVFLERTPRFDYRENGQTIPVDATDENNRVVIKVSQGSFGWGEGQLALKQLRFELSPGLTMIVGPVASGKSTLCKALLGETLVYSGVVSIGSYSRRIGYCDQSPFLLNATIKENILGHSPFNPTRYREVVEATLLLPDLANLPLGDNTKVGSEGITLSGGQKQRISMARALYLESSLFIFDDILSGLDATTEHQVFQRVFGPSGLLHRRHATAVLCTHAPDRLSSADHILVLGDGGSLVGQGSFEDLIEMGKHIHGLDLKTAESALTSDFSEADSKVEDSEKSLDDGTDTATLCNVGEVGSQLSDWAVYKHYANNMSLLALLATFFLGASSGFLFNFPQVWLNYWSADATVSHHVHAERYWIGIYALLQVLFLFSIAAMCIVVFIAITSQSGTSLHHQALRTVINAPLQFFVQTDVGVVTNLFSQDLMLIDTELPEALLNFILEIFCFIGMAAIIATSSSYLVISYPVLIAVLWVIQRVYLRTSKQLRMLDLEMKSPLYTNFGDTINGLVTMRAFAWEDHYEQLNNRLLDDSQRPAYLLAMIQHWLNFVLNLLVVAMALLVVVISTQVTSVANTGLTGASLVTLMSFGEAISRLITVYTQLETSIGAVSRLKSFGENVPSEKLPGEDMPVPPLWPRHGEIHINGVSASYGNSVGDMTSEKPEANRLVLKDLVISIRAGEKVAICGRSGSGKSSMLLLLLRLLDQVSECAGTITIDGIPLNKVDRSMLRERVIAVPQDPVFLPDGTSFKTNLDPFDELTDDQCREILDMVGLGGLLDEREGLGSGMWADRLSYGQKQLFSLARAIVRHRVRIHEVSAAPVVSKDVPCAQQDACLDGEHGDVLGGVLLLDEVSSSVDDDAHQKMHALIQREFSAYTVIAVVHRLDIVMDYDRVLMMDNGSIIESGQPRELAKQETSSFSRLWVTTTGH
ncbi:ABC transporter FGM5 [Cladobotryum mycophilum]|uniref:ABC transporter FGM5 n=1 Tax=Cladobotryum mycophilum TaxID=491253 RepID=A0ABR0SQM5_9HYPO